MKLRTFLATLSIFSLITGCAALSPKEPQESYSAVFQANYDELWRALQKSISRYPIRLNNADTGQLETDLIKPAQMWQPAHEKREFSPGERYFIKVSTTRGEMRGKTESVRLTIEKVMTIERDFFAGEQKKYSDGLEEKSILYRIQRELTMEQSLKNAYENGQLNGGGGSGQ